MDLNRIRRSLSLAAALAALSASAGTAEAPAGSNGSIPAITASGVVLGPDDAPRPGARVELRPLLSGFAAGVLRLEDGSVAGAVAVAATGPDGRFVLRAQEPGLWEVRVEAAGAVPMQYGPLPLVEPVELPPLSLTPGEEAEIRVLRADGEPLAGAWVFADRPEPAEAPGRGGLGWRMPFRAVRTDKSGRAVIPRLPGETPELGILRAGAATPERISRLEKGTAQLLPRELAERTVEVRDPRGAPVAGALVRAGSFAWPVGRTGADGRLRVLAGRGEPLDLRLQAEDGRREAIEEASPGERDKDPRVLVLADPVWLAGRVTLEGGGRAVHPVLVWSGGDPGAFVQADAQGLYRIVAPAPTRWWLQAETAGYLPRRTWIGEAQRASGRAPALTLPLGTALHGRVVDSSGAPLSGVRIAAVRPRRERPPFARPDPAQSRAFSDRRGAFTLTGVGPGESYVLVAARPGSVTTRVRVTVEALGRPSPGVEIVLPANRPVLGLVVDEEGRPLPGAEVVLRPADDRRRSVWRPAGPSGAASGPADPFRARTGPDGRFATAAVPAPRLDVTVVRRGHAPLVLLGVAVPAGEGPFDLGRLILLRGAAVQGRVVDAQEQPVAGAAIHVFGFERRSQYVDEEELRRQTPDTVTGAAGRFAIEDLRSGDQVDLFVLADGYLPARVRAVRAPSSEPLLVFLEEAASLRGRVVDRSGEPVADADVLLEWQASLPEIEEIRTGAPVLHTAVSDAAGAFRFGNVRIGKARLQVHAEGYLPVEPFEVEVPAGGPSQEIVVTVERGASLSGRVTTSEGDPVEQARIGVGTPDALSDAEGVYRVQGIPAGLQEVVVFHPNYRRAVRSVEIEPGLNRLDVTLPAGQEVTGHVVDPDGVPVPGARVTLEWERSWEKLLYSALTGADGGFRLAEVAEGIYRLEAVADGYPPAARREPVTVSKAPVTGLEVVLEPGGAIAGRILGLDREELSSVLVSASADGRRPATGRVDAEGRYRIEELAPGDWIVLASLGQGQRQVQVRVPIAPGVREVTRDLEFGSGLTLAGEVLLNDRVLPGAGVSLRGHQVAVERSVVTNHEGRFRILDLDPGRYWLGVDHPVEAVALNETIDLSADRDLRLPLYNSMVSGRVLDSADSRPVPSALVVLQRIAAEESERAIIARAADEQGEFRLPRVVPGRYEISARKEGFAVTTQTLEVRPRVDLENVELLLSGTQGLRLGVRLQSGGLPPSVNVLVLDGTGRAVTYETRQPDDRGEVHLPSVPSGTWEVAVDAPGGAMARAAVSVPGDPVTLVLPAASPLSVLVPALATSNLIGTLTLASPDGSAFLALDESGGIRSQWPVVGGRALVKGLPAGRWELRVTLSDGRSWTGTATATGTSPAAVQLE